MWGSGVRHDAGMRNERGLAPSVEAAILLPALTMVIGLIIVLAQVALAHQEVRAVAAAAARAASTERSPAAGRKAADEQVIASDTCRSPRIVVDASALALPVGVAGKINVSVTCVVPLQAVGFRAVPGSVEATAEASSPVDRYRSR